GNAPRRRPRGQCLSGADRRRVEPAAAAAETRAGGARQRDRRGLASRRRRRLSRRRGAGLARALARQPEGARARGGRMKEQVMGTDTLARLVADLAAGSIRVVDLTQTLSPEFPQIVLPPEMGQAWPFRIEEISRFDERGPGYYWNNF